MRPPVVCLACPTDGHYRYYLHDPDVSCEWVTHRFEEASDESPISLLALAQTLLSRYVGGPLILVKSNFHVGGLDLYHVQTPPGDQPQTKKGLLDWLDNTPLRVTKCYRPRWYHPEPQPLAAPGGWLPIDDETEAEIGLSRMVSRAYDRFKAREIAAGRGWGL